MVIAPANATIVRALLRSDDSETPVLLWKHFRSEDAGELARLTVAFFHEYRLAAAKIMPDIPVLFRDFSLSSWSQVAHLRRFGPIETVGRAPEYIRAVRLARSKLNDADLLLVTVFSPLALVALWCGPQALREMAGGNRAEAHSVLAALGGVVSSLAERCVAAGANGVYYSCWGQDVLSADEYREFGVPYDLAGLRGAEMADVRFLHVHGALNEGTERYADYPVEVVGWSEVDSRVSLSEGAQLLPNQLVMGGISERALAKPGVDARRHIAQLVESLGPRFIAGPGCSLPDEIDAEGLAALRALVHG